MGGTLDQCNCTGLTSDVHGRFQWVITPHIVLVVQTHQNSQSQNIRVRSVWKKYIVIIEKEYKKKLQANGPSCKSLLW